MSDIPLGRQVEYPERYAPEVLAPIPRRPNRERLGLEGGRELPFFGADVWNAYELSWLGPRGKPQIATARFVFPCDSARIIESKSLKLYLGSFNQERFASSEEPGRLLRQDLGRAAEGDVRVIIQSLADFQRCLPEEPAGICLDLLDVEISSYELDPGLLEPEKPSPIVEEALYTELFRSACPVTGQPDWATVTVCYRGRKISQASLLRYLISYRRHRDYHENCVERIFLDLRQRCQPLALTVEANFLRRGGLDINPVRSTVNITDYEGFPRYIRQ